MLDSLRHFLGLEGPAFGGTRSPEWPHVRAAFIKNHPLCAVCGSTGSVLNPLNAHHVLVFHLNPGKELDPTNLITLCRIHHFWWGHLGNWASFNAEVREDASTWHAKIVARP